MMFNALSSLHLITVINKHGGTSSYKVNWDKSGLLSNCKYCISAASCSGCVMEVTVFYIAFSLFCCCCSINLNVIGSDCSVYIA